MLTGNRHPRHLGMIKLIFVDIFLSDHESRPIVLLKIFLLFLPRILKFKIVVIGIDACHIHFVDLFSLLWSLESPLGHQEAILGHVSIVHIIQNGDISVEVFLFLFTFVKGSIPVLSLSP